MNSYSYNKDNVISWLKNDHWHCCNKKCKHELTHRHEICSCGMTFFIYRREADKIIVYYKVGQLIHVGTNGRRVVIGKPEKIFPIDREGNIDFNSELPLMEQFLVKNIMFLKISKLLFNIETPLKLFLDKLEEEKKRKKEKEEKKKKTAQVAV